MNLSDYSKYDIDRGIYYGHPKIVSPPPLKIFLILPCFLRKQFHLTKVTFGTLRTVTPTGDSKSSYWLLLFSFFPLFSFPFPPSQLISISPKTTTCVSRPEFLFRNPFCNLSKMEKTMLWNRK